ncbi:Protein O-mannosyl-transferase tmtc2 [Ilyodon furcidens]|uniref:Protein O-mannosyl-transferase tmtc2 n=1 Tax=Ilyodon furcidens TaxID=33524 RepID=A0ABV0TT96_9TELE
MLHGLVTALVTALSHSLLGRGLWSLLAGLLFASHPVHTEAVAGVVGRADVGAALFFLLSLLCYVRHCGLRGDKWKAFQRRTCGGSSTTRCWGWMLGSLWCAAASMLWKEQGVTVLAVSAVYDLFVFQKLRFRQALLLLLGKVSFPKIHNYAPYASTAGTLCRAIFPPSKLKEFEEDILDTVTQLIIEMCVIV